MKAIWNGTVIAESDKTINVEGNQYFPKDTVKREYIADSNTQTVCAWKGTASYFDVVVDGKTNKDAAWFYPETSELASNIRNYVAFWKGVEVKN